MAKINAQGRAVEIKDAGHFARVQFVNWLKSAEPNLYVRVMSRVEQLDGLGIVEPLPSITSQISMKPASLWERITGSIAELGTAYAGYKAQSTMLDINLERARAGLPPLDAASMAPVVRTQIDLTPEMAQRLQDAGTAGLMKIALYGGIALAAFLLLKK